MKNKKMYLLALAAMILFTTGFVSCKKGEDDPIISAKTRKDRFTNTWTLSRYEKNGTTQDLNGTEYVYNAFNNGDLTRTVQGSVFGFPTRTVTNGTWTFANDDEDVKILLNNQITTYNIQRLATKELWLRTIESSDTLVYYFEGL